MEKDYGIAFNVTSNTVDVISIKAGEDFLKKEYRLQVDNHKHELGDFCSLELDENDQIVAVIKTDLDEAEFRTLSHLSEEDVNILIGKMHPGPPHSHDGQVDDPPPSSNTIIIKTGHEKPRHIDEKKYGDRYDYLFDFGNRFPDKENVTFVGISHNNKNFAIFVFKKQ